MNVKTWLLTKLRDDQKHADIDRREREADSLIADLRAERENRDTFGKLFDTAVRPVALPPVPAHPHKRKKR